MDVINEIDILHIPAGTSKVVEFPCNIPQRWVARGELGGSVILCFIVEAAADKSVCKGSCTQNMGRYISASLRQYLCYVSLCRLIDKDKPRQESRGLLNTNQYIGII